MPFLRGTDASALHELRSSKNLIGTSPSKCDVVVRHAGVRELHALLSLAPDRASATLVPFSATDAGGVCFVNKRTVPLEGVAVIHGDEIALGSADSPASFTFELTPPRSASASVSHTRSRQSTARNGSASGSTASFRRALDALRRDPLATSPSRSNGALSKRMQQQQQQSSARASVASPVTTTRVNSTASSVASASNEQLSKFLLDASSDSLLSEYVERKLRQSAQSRRTARTHRKRAFAPMAMEPPPSLSSSNVSSVQSLAGLDDSILDRSAAATDFASSSSVSLLHSRKEARDRRSNQTDLRGDDGSALGLSSEERSAAEVEKLRLSQQLREVDSVLRGDTPFQASYLASSFSAQSAHSPPPPTRIDQTNDTLHNSESDDDDDDELPAMVEKAKPVARQVVAALSPTAAQAPVAPPTTAAEHIGDEDDPEDDSHLDESLPSFSEPVRASQRLKPKLAYAAQSQQEPRSESPLASRPSARKRTALHQQLIDQTLRHRRQELITQTFVRWRRGLRIQAQNRQLRMQQLRMLDAKLARLRRNRMFAKWRAFASVASQVLSCRVDAFQARSMHRNLQRVWTQWRLLHALKHLRRQQLLAGAVRRLLTATTQRAFHLWSLRTHTHRHREQLEYREYDFRAQWDTRMTAIAARHHAHRVLRAHLTCWRALAALQSRKLRVLAKLALRGSARLLLRAWRTWTDKVLLLSHAHAIASAERAHASQLLADQRAEHEQKQTILQREHETELQRVRSQLAERDRHVLSLRQREEAREAAEQQQQRDDDKRKVDVMHDWSQRVERFLEGVVGRCDRQIAQASADLEQILALAEQDVAGARFVAARVLVEVLLEQKVHNSNELVATQEQLVASMQQCPQRAASVKPEQLETGETTKLSANASFLQDMAQQRIRRLHQLLSAVAKLAAAATADRGSTGTQQQQFDAAKLRHSAFLTDAICEREQRHVKDMTAALFKLSSVTWSSKSAGVETSLPAATA